MSRAVENYVRYRASPEEWMLGRFVVPVARLDEFEAAANGAAPLVSALIGADLASDLDRIARSPFLIDAIEMKATESDQVESAMKRMPPRLTPYFEITDLQLIPAIRDTGARAKIRTGGITPEAFPEAAEIAKFLLACAENNVPFKATAGLHHPLRCHRPLTYSPDGPSGWMFGFLNVFLAAVLARQGLSEDLLEQLLMEETPAAFQLSDAQITWAGHTLNVEEIAAGRREFAISLGSCSFEEPVADLKSLGLL